MTATAVSKSQVRFRSSTLPTLRMCFQSRLTASVDSGNRPASHAQLHRRDSATARACGETQPAAAVAAMAP